MSFEKIRIVSSLGAMQLSIQAFTSLQIGLIGLVITKSAIHFAGNMLDSGISGDGMDLQCLDKQTPFVEQISLVVMFSILIKERIMTSMARATPGATRSIKMIFIVTSIVTISTIVNSVNFNIMMGQNWPPLATLGTRAHNFINVTIMLVTGL